MQIAEHEQAVRHHRIAQMRKAAKRCGKVVPSYDDLERMVASLVDNKMRCPVCARQMNWLIRDGHSTTVTLQHDRCGTIRLICFGCNSRHQHYPGDTLYELDVNKKRCNLCGETKDKSEFYYMKARKSFNSGCKQCLRAYQLKRYHENSEQWNARHRAWLAKNRRMA